ncbi:class I SAM-dependent methyltransferase [Roseomonas genomospecies 6]|uniref:Class I SAM-dependent methyltransferase n=1 Tax=Roseomonas genomospecies 6 TaxID=214106 RepID=A0A9W7NGM4_9PROT|nr:class I SAM-dependent methyltransferase [Roseomonas genomospecies 6]
MLTVTETHRTHVLLRCGVCTAHFYEDRTPPSYEDDPSDDYTAYYAEQGADVWGMTDTLSRLRAHRPASLLDVGCGFGFTVDMAARCFGWRAVGVDPCGLAQSGAKLLDAPIVTRYLDRDSGIGEPFDLVHSSEVIEHIDDPYGFIGILRHHLAPGGIVVLKTPNAEAVTPSFAPGMLRALLAPGSHLILYTPLSIRRALRKAGFDHVVVEANGSCLTAFASDAPITLSSSGGEGGHASVYARYLEERMRVSPPGGPVWNGAAARLFRHRTLNGRFLEALELYGTLARTYEESFGIDLLRPRRIPIASCDPTGGPGRARRAPYNLASVLFTRGLLARCLPAQDPLETLAFLRVAERLAVEMGGALQAGGLFDGDLENTALQARCEAVDALWPIDPDAAIGALVSLGRPTGSRFDGQTVVPPVLRLHKAAPLFVRLVHDGDYRLAVHLFDLFEDQELVERSLPKDGTLLHLAFCLAILDLNVYARRDRVLDRLRWLQRLAEQLKQVPEHAENARHMMSVATEHMAMIAAS